MDKGTITWIPIEDNNYPPLDPNSWSSLGFYSKKVLITDGVWITSTRFSYSPIKSPLDWQDYHLPFTPTHWAYINYPE